jgi:hypothetical protein
LGNLVIEKDLYRRHDNCTLRQPIRKRLKSSEEISCRIWISVEQVLQTLLDTLTIVIVLISRLEAKSVRELGQDTKWQRSTVTVRESRIELQEVTNSARRSWTTSIRESKMQWGTLVPIAGTNRGVVGACENIESFF